MLSRAKALRNFGGIGQGFDFVGFGYGLFKGGIVAFIGVSDQLALLMIVRLYLINEQHLLPIGSGSIVDAEMDDLLVLEVLGKVTIANDWIFHLSDLAGDEIHFIAEIKIVGAVFFNGFLCFCEANTQFGNVYFLFWGCFAGDALSKLRQADKQFAVVRSARNLMLTESRGRIIGLCPTFADILSSSSVS